MSRSVSRSAVVHAPPTEVFSLLADPRRHVELDGSGTVTDVVKGPDRLSLGDRFVMRMRLGVPYVISNEVVELEPDRRIAWRQVGHRVWRYELEPVDGGTRVTETFDWAHARSPLALELLGIPARNARSIDATLERLRKRFA
ncbi:SRPBCC family protein [soil metagenome]